MTHRTLGISICGGVLAVSLAANASAGPESVPALLDIIRTLRRMQTTLDGIRDAVSATRDTLEQVYPASAIHAIGTVFDAVGTIQDEVRALRCPWRFSDRTKRLWDGLFRGVPMCKDDYELVYGAPSEYVLGDMDEYLDYTATRRLNMVSTRVARGPAHAVFLHWLLAESEKGRATPEDQSPYGPGYSQRLSAVGAAALGNVLLEQGDTMTAQLEGFAQERVNERRLKQKLATDLALDAYARLAGSAEPSREVFP